MNTLTAIVASIAALSVLAAPTWGGNAAMSGIPHDWSHRHLVFSQPSSVQQQHGLERKARFRMQRAWRIRQSLLRSAPALDAKAMSIVQSWSQAGVAKNPRLKGLWSVNMGTGATAGNGMYPAKFSFDTESPGNCASAASPDFVAFNTGLAGAADHATVLAYDNLYSGCTGTVPSVYWAYDTGTGSIAATSVVLSADGSQVAFVQNSSAGLAHLVILKWKPSSATVSLSDTAADAYRTCTAPCMTSLTFHGSPSDSNSPPFYAYDQDVLYVGDDAGDLHKFQHIFNSGTPAEVTANWPIVIHNGSSLTGPVFDSVSGNSGSGNVFVGDASGRLSYVRDSGSTSGACASGTPPCLGTPFISLGGSVVDPPMVDGSTERVFWFNGTAPTTDPVNFGEVVQTNTALGEQTNLLGVGGSSSSTTRMHDGDFDNTYYNSSANKIGGFLYLCGKNIVFTDRPALYRVGFSASGVMKTSPNNTSPLTLTSNSPSECSPITEADNAGVDRIFLSVQRSGNRTGCTGACLYSFTITNSFPANASAGLTAAGGTSGIIIDNTATSPAGASQVYFTPLTNQTCLSGGAGGCATQASQAGLN